MRELTIGYPTTCYGMARLSHDLPVAKYGLHYRKVRRLPLHRLPLAPAYWDYVARVLPGTRVDALHTFNRVCTGSVPWVCSFEMEYPRYFGVVPPAAFRRAYSRMASASCWALLPLSRAASDYFLRRVPENLVSQIEPKLHVFTGGVSIPECALHAREQALAAPASCFRIGFVGRDLWRKGGEALVAAVGILRREHDVRLLIVGDVAAIDNYVGEISSAARQQAISTLRHAPWVEHYERLPNTQTLEKLAGCDTLILPTLDESLGWAVIEAQGLGLPVLTTNVFAMPELVHDRVHGRLCSLPLDEDRRWVGVTAHGPRRKSVYEDTIHLMTHWIVDVVADLINRPSQGLAFGQAGRQHFLACYEPSVAARELAEVIRVRSINRTPP